MDHAVHCVQQPAAVSSRHRNDTDSKIAATNANDEQNSLFRLVDCNLVRRPKNDRFDGAMYLHRKLRQQTAIINVAPNILLTCTQSITASYTHSRARPLAGGDGDGGADRYICFSLSALSRWPPCRQWNSCTAQRADDGNGVE